MLDDVVWAEPRFPHGRVDAAGKTLVSLTLKPSRYGSEDLGLESALEVIDNWRSSHSYPLQIVNMNLRTRAQAVETDPLVAQRLKRLSSIYLKLANEPTMKLSQMQDIGGCRAVLSSIPRLQKLVEKYNLDFARYLRDKKRGHIRLDKSLIIEKYDYLTQPKDDGYRGVHFVCKYQTANKPHRVHSGLRIEIQLRSKLQHLWATAVEVAQTFTHEALRSRRGHKDWRRFFALMGTVLAIREGMARVPGTPEDDSELIAELRRLCDQLRVLIFLEAYGDFASIVTRSAGKAKLFLLELDPEIRILKVSPFRGQDVAEATATLFASEKDMRDESLKVLVSVDSIHALKRAYPNYYLDTTEFLRAVKEAIA